MLRTRSCVHEDVLLLYVQQPRSAAHADAAANRGSDAQRPAPADAMTAAVAASGAGAQRPERVPAPSGAASSPRADAAAKQGIDAAAEQGADARRAAPEAAAAAAPSGTVDARHDTGDTDAALAGAAQQGPGPGGLCGSEEVPVVPPGQQGPMDEQRVPKPSRTAPVPSAERVEVIVLD